MVAVEAYFSREARSIINSDRKGNASRQKSRLNKSTDSLHTLSLPAMRSGFELTAEDTGEAISKLQCIITTGVLSRLLHWSIIFTLEKAS